jgi:hypothetical protein
VNDEHIEFGLLDLNSEGAQGIDRAHAIVTWKKSTQRAHPIGKRSDDRGPMRNTFVARDGDFSLNSRRSFYA